MFNEANSVEDYVRDLLCGKQDAAVREPLFKGASLTPLAAGLGWQFIPADRLPRDFNDVLVETHLREALIRLNPEIAEKPDRAEEVIYKLRAILLSVQSDGLVRANEEFTAWLRGERSMPFGPNNEHTPVRLVDFDTLGNNQFVCTQQFVYSPKKRNWSGLRVQREVLRG
jgi:type I restriction enzyme R subunit